MPQIRDIVAPGLRALFVGINPGLRSAALGHNFAGKGNPFWRLLFAAKLIDEPLTFAEERRLVDFGFGITNVCARPSRTAGELTRAELAAGARDLERRVRRLRPRVVVLVGLTIYRQIFGRAATPGAGAKPQTFGGARLFVVPNPSGLNASFPGFAQKLVWFEALREFLASDDISGQSPHEGDSRESPRADERDSRESPRADEGDSRQSPPVKAARGRGLQRARRVARQE